MWDEERKTMTYMLESILEVIEVLYIIESNDDILYGMNGETTVMLRGLFSRVGGVGSKDVSILDGVRRIPIMVTGLLDRYRKSALAEVLKDQEGDLLPTGYKKRRDNKMGGYYITGIAGIYVLSKIIVRLVSKFDFIALPIGVSLSCFIVITIYNIGVWREFIMMAGTYRDRKRRGVYDMQKRGMGGVPGGGKDFLRLALKAGKSLGGGALATAAGIEAANTIGRGFGNGDVGTKAMESVTKKAGLHKSVRGANKEETSKKG